MKQYSLTLDPRSADALARVSHILGLSRSDVTRRLVLLADAAVFWGVQGSVADASDVELTELAKKGLLEWGLMTLAWDDLPDAASIGKLGPHRIEVGR